MMFENISGKNKEFQFQNFEIKICIIIKFEFRFRNLKKRLGYFKLMILFSCLGNYIQFHAQGDILDTSSLFSMYLQQFHYLS